MIKNDKFEQLVHKIFLKIDIYIMLFFYYNFKNFYTKIIIEIIFSYLFLLFKLVKKKFLM